MVSLSLMVILLLTSTGSSEGQEKTWVAMNSLQWPRQEVVQDPDTKDLMLLTVPSMGYSVFQPTDPPVPVTLSKLPIQV